MKRPNITPREWRQHNKIGIKAGFHDVLDSNEDTIVFVRVGKHAKANGKAIAALPKLLDALELMLKAFNGRDVDALVALVATERARAALLAAGYTE